MARFPRFDRRYLRDARRLGVWGGTDASRAVAHALAALELAEMLPGPGDVYTYVPDSVRPGDATAVPKLAHVRRVTGHNLWLWYWPSETAR